MLIDDLRRNKSAIEALARKHGAGKIRVFGSIARGEEHPECDIDFLVEFPRGYDLFTQRLALQRNLESLIGRPVDLIPDHELSPHVRNEVLREAREL